MHPAPRSASRPPYSSVSSSHSDLNNTEVVTTNRVVSSHDKETKRKMINQYIVMNEVGRGMHGKVRKGLDTETNEYVAIKIVRREDPRHRNLSHAMAAARRQSQLGAVPSMSAAIGTTESKIRREIAIMKKCHHEHVVRLREIIDDPMNKKIFLVLEYMSGGEVKWRTQDPENQPLLTVVETRHMFRDVVLGLEYLHYQGIIHRDIKPANLLLTENGTVKISDFGVSHFSYALRLASIGQDEASIESPEAKEVLMDDRDLTKTAGSPAFFAPELCFQGEDFDTVAPLNLSSTVTQRVSAQRAPRPSRMPVTKAIDVWALGVTLYCLLFGRPPFTAVSEFALYNIIPKQDFDIPPFMGKDAVPTGGRNKGVEGQGEGWEVVHLLERLMEKDPLKRITLQEVKRMSWVQRGLDDPERWITETAPDREAAVFVTPADADGAFTTKSKLKQKVAHIASKLWRPFSGRRRGDSTSSVNVLEDETEKGIRQLSIGRHIGIPGVHASRPSPWNVVSGPGRASRDRSRDRAASPSRSPGHSKMFSLFNPSPRSPVTPTRERGLPSPNTPVGSLSDTSEARFIVPPQSTSKTPKARRSSGSLLSPADAGQIRTQSLGTVSRPHMIQGSTRSANFADETQPPRGDRRKPRQWLTRKPRSQREKDESADPNASGGDDIDKPMVFRRNSDEDTAGSSLESTGIHKRVADHHRDRIEWSDGESDRRSNLIYDSNAYTSFSDFSDGSDLGEEYEETSMLGAGGFGWRNAGAGWQPTQVVSSHPPASRSVELSFSPPTIPHILDSPHNHSVPTRPADIAEDDGGGEDDEDEAEDYLQMPQRRRP